ncbi:hypothetical protein GN958_ATG09349 [Phytophthora infestans]|nr:hypothetical protein GN958_ATG09349 [Phytophthora infestans]
MTAELDVEGSLEEAASTRFSESSAFPELLPVVDTLLFTTVPRTKHADQPQLCCKESPIQL